ncbi:MAG: hypothetical protein LBR13_05850, partial [Dysgonamonadaceae bacterium]|nr:hypothetical protein [Dysgonamonadaceae bacterium]
MKKSRKIQKVANLILLIIFNFQFSIFNSSCGEPLMDYDINTDTPIVESYLQEGSNALSVKVYSMEAYLKDDYKVSKPVSGLQMTVNGQQLTESPSGTYTLNLQTDTIREKQNFDLHFDYNGKTIAASTTVPLQVTNLKADPTSLTVSSSYTFFYDDSDTTQVLVTWDDPDGDYYQVYIVSPNTSDMPSLGMFGRRMMQPFKGSSYSASAREFRSEGFHFIYVYRV